ncbi:MAG: flavodoxin domain-containing protein [Gammaproteobacteria bacterium]|nr:flavodoxin domain-containing protein [Gammaproteobacteria bacterium]
MASITLLTGSVYGAARLTAQAVADALRGAGHDVHFPDAPSVQDLDPEDSALLVCTSTTGQGELPASILPLYLSLRDTLPQYPGRPFGVIVLGDSSYGTTYCGAGELMREVLFEMACRETLPMLRIDALEVTDPEAPAIAWAQEWVQTL